MTPPEDPSAPPPDIAAEDAPEDAGARSEARDEEVALLPIEDAIDLHGFQPRDVPSVVAEYLQAAFERGFREVRLIHGRGIGVQRARVRQVLAESALVERFADAPAQRGGWGATIVWLRAAPHSGEEGAGE